MNISRMSGLFTKWQMFGFGAAICFLVIYLNIAEDVFTNDSIVKFDHSFGCVVQGLRTPRMSSLMLLITYLGNWQIIGAGLLLSIYYLARERQWINAAGLLTSVFGGELLVFLSKTGFSRARPDTLNALIPAKGLSFPSGHAFVAITFYGFLAWAVMTETRSMPARITLLLVVSGLAIAVGFSRIYLGVHWPSDVLASYFLALAWVTILTTIFRTFISTPHESGPASAVVDPRVLLAIWLATIAIFYYFHPLAV